MAASFDTWDQLNQQAGAKVATPAAKPTPTQKTWDSLNAAVQKPSTNKFGTDVSSHVFNPLNQNSQFVDPSTPTPKINYAEAFKPQNLITAAKQVMPGAAQTVSQIKADPLSTKSDYGTTMKTNLVDLAQGKLTPTQFAVKSLDTKRTLANAWNVVKDAVAQEGTNLKNLFDARPQNGQFSPSKAGGAGLKVVTGGANILFSPLTALFNRANEVPILGTVSRLITLPFQAMGDGGAGLGNAVVNKLPISDEAKNQIRPGVEQIFALAAQIALGKAGLDVKAWDALKSKFGETDARTIYDQANRLAQQKVAQTTAPETSNTSPEVQTKTSKKASPLKNVMGQELPQYLGVDEVLANQKNIKFSDGTSKTQSKSLPVNQVEPVATEGVTKTSKLASGVEAKAVEKGLTRGFEGKPEYATVNMKAQAEAAVKLLEESPEQAHSIAMGNELPPEGILPEAVFTAVENHALEHGDVSTLRDLATSSSLTTEATGMGQRIRALAERNPDSAVAQIQDVLKAREEKAMKTNKDLGKAKKNIAEDIKKEISKTHTKETWSSFVESLKC